MMYCKNCGKEVTEDSNFCLYCGNKLNKEKYNKMEKGILRTTNWLKFFLMFIFIVMMLFVLTEGRVLGQYIFIIFIFMLIIIVVGIFLRKSELEKVYKTGIETKKKRNGDDILTIASAIAAGFIIIIIAIIIMILPIIPFEMCGQLLGYKVGCVTTHVSIFDIILDKLKLIR